jgi:hypothetical protein
MLVLRLISKKSNLHKIVILFSDQLSADLTWQTPIFANLHNRILTVKRFAYFSWIPSEKFQKKKL